MAEYFYLIATLPLLSFQDRAPMGYQDLVTVCSRWLRYRDWLQFQLARTDIENVQLEKVTQPELRRWFIFEHSLRTIIVEFRADRLGISAEPHLQPSTDVEPIVYPALHQILIEASPYKAEVELLRIRWDFLAELEVGHYFDSTALAIYALKLQLLERKDQFQKEAGRQILRGITGVSTGHDES